MPYSLEPQFFEFMTSFLYTSRWGEVDDMIQNSGRWIGDVG